MIYKDPIRHIKWSEKEIKNTENNLKAFQAVELFLKNNTDLNLGCVIDNIKNRMMSTTQCCKQLGISPRAFLRLRRKYNIEPVYTAAHSRKSNIVGSFGRMMPKKAVKNYYTSFQLNKISKDEINLVQKRFARSMGKKLPMAWTTRGRNENGKLKARINNLIKCKIGVVYDSNIDKYHVLDRTSNKGSWLTKQEVDKLNIRYGKLLAFT